MANNEIVWFDFTAYGVDTAVPAKTDTLKEVLEQAERMVSNQKNCQSEEDDFYMNAWYDYLVKFRPVMDPDTWRISVLIHIAVCGLKGIAEPPIIHDY